MFLFDSLRAFVKPLKLGKPQIAPLRVRIMEGKFREPDVTFRSLNTTASAAMTIGWARIL